MPEINIKEPSKTEKQFKSKSPSGSSGLLDAQSVSKTLTSTNAKFTNYSDEQIATRQAYGNALAALAIADNSIIAIDAEVNDSTYSKKVKEKTPEQFINAFIAEQNMISMALGLSKKGFNVFASTFSAFLTRAHDQIRMAALSKPNLTICGSHAGVSIGEDGASQMGLEDISLFRALANSIIFYPSDAISTEKLG